MSTAVHGATPGAFIQRLHRATNDHDLDALLGCFVSDFRNETPAHPAPSFEGRDQVRRNWAQIFAAVPDLTTDVARIADENTVWSEWEMRGTRRDGTSHLMRGVVIFGVQDDQAAWARFYLEPVEAGGDNADAAVQRMVGLPGAES